MRRETPRNNLSYNDACHAMQTGVAIEMESGTLKETEPKHLRVGVNSLMVDNTAMARLLVKKGLITMDEYLEEVRLEMNREVDAYEDRIRARVGPSVNLR